MRNIHYSKYFFLFVIQSEKKAKYSLHYDSANKLIVNLGGDGVNREIMCLDLMGVQWEAIETFTSVNVINKNSLPTLRSINKQKINYIPEYSLIINTNKADFNLYAFIPTMDSLKDIFSYLITLNNADIDTLIEDFITNMPISDLEKQELESVMEGLYEDHFDSLNNEI